jgi:hypothetical protein
VKLTGERKMMFMPSVDLSFTFLLASFKFADADSLDYNILKTKWASHVRSLKDLVRPEMIEPLLGIDVKYLNP